MAYDLILGRIERNVARDSGVPPTRRSRLLGTLCFLAAGILFVGPEIQRGRETRRWKRELDDPTLGVTQELPAISMHEMVYGREA